MNCQITSLKPALALVIFMTLGWTTMVFSQTPTVTVRFANPQFDCLADQYCLDVEFQSDQEGVELFGMNVRFFYDDDILELVGFSDFQGGYGPVSPDPPIVSTNGPAGPALFNFGGPADFVNGAIQLVDDLAPQIILTTNGWTKLFQMCFTIDDPNADLQNFCPPIVWDLEQDPTEGGFLTGDDGVVITIVDPDPNIESSPAEENVVQFNWEYIGNGSAPYGQPVELECSVIDCSGSLSVLKTDFLDLGDNGTLNPGDIIYYTITIINDGPVPVSDVTVDDPGVMGLACIPMTPFTIDPGDTVVCTASYAVTLTDIEAGFYVNVAIVSGVDPDDDPVSDPSDDPDDPTDDDPNQDGNPDDPTITPLIPTPIITVRFSNPQFNCLAEEYCLDVEFMSDTEGLELFGMNVRFFYDDDILELIDFRDYQGGYGPISPDPPSVTTFPLVGPALFSFGGPADFVNGAVQLLDDSQPPIFISTTGWTKLYQVCFTVEDPFANVNNFCPPVVWDMEQDPNNGGFLVGDDGVVITVVDPDPNLMSAPVIENVVQFNWQYTGDGITLPFGEPVENECISINCFPMITCAPDITIECDISTDPIITGSATATDMCDGDPVITFTDVTLGGGCPQEYTITRTWIALNACDLADTCEQIIMIIDTTGPEIFCPPDMTIECTDSTSPDDTGEPTSTDNCDTEPTVTFSDVTAGGGCPQEYSISRTWLATDDCGNSSSCTQTIIVDDSTVPGIMCPADMTIECTSSTDPGSTGTATATDNCDLTPDVTFTDVTAGGGCLQEYTISRTWLAMDDCGNTSTCVQTIIVDDSQVPTLTCPGNLTVSCASEVPTFDTEDVTSTDNCGGLITISHVGDVITNQTCANRFTVTRTYRATDACGNSATCAQIILVNDQTPPTITCPGSITVSCASQVPPFNTNSVIAADNCGGMMDVTYLGDVISNQTCINRFTITRTYQAADLCGNTATCTQIITVNDVTPPVITCPIDVTIDFGDSTEPENTETASGTDNCGGTPMITYSDMSIAGTCIEEFTINRTWTATDACGNTSTCLQVIEVDGACEIDLSLIKELGPGQGPILPGQDVTFTITVTNEGQSDIGAVTIIDYIPTGFVLNDSDWTPGMDGSTGQSATITLSIMNGGLDANGLNPGESVSVNITLQALPDIGPGIYINIAEILFVFDVNGNDVTDNDVDSDPDNDDTNDPEDEDDHDVVGICILPQPVITGDHYVCPEEIVTYFVNDYNPAFTYVWTLNGGGVIIDDIGSSINVQWQEEPGGPFEISLEVIIGPGCSAFAFFNVYIQGVETLACNDHIQISIGPDCESVILSGVILEGEAEGNNNYFVVITDQDGNIIPDATLTYEHVGHTYMVSVQNECNNQSCWGTISVEDKIPPVITCTDAVIPCGTPLEPVFSQPITGSASQSVISGLPIGPDGGTITSQPIDLITLSNALVTDVNVTIDLVHTWSGDLLVQLISPNGTVITLANAVCGPADNWDNVTFNDQALTPVATACNLTPPPALLQGHVIPEEALSTFNGEFADGEWIVQITDLANGDAGILNSVTLNVTYLVSLPYAPEASDACGVVTLSYTEIESGEDCEDLTITRTWTATDGSGNTATCNQIITIIPLDLEDVLFPDTYIGECGETVSPDFTGWPTLNGQQITDQSALCNIFLGYWDKELVECGGGRKIVRTWTVLDWCTLDFIEGVQVIKLTDTEGPLLTCPQDLTVGTDFWYCYANVSVPHPDAYDECSGIDSYSLTSTGGTVVSYGNNYVINGLELGTYTVTWTVTDECGNSSTCSFNITVKDNAAPVANCDQHTIVSLTNDGPGGVTIVPAGVFDDGSYDNCGPVTLRVRRMTSCIEFDWTTEGACADDIPNGIVNSRDQGTISRACVPFSCCDIKYDANHNPIPVMVELEVTDAAGNRNFCMVEAIVQDKISPYIVCPPDIIVSCDFWFNVQEGTYVDANSNNNGQLDEDPLSRVFGNMYDAFRYHESYRGNIIVDDPGNHTISQPHHWGIEGWADDNCQVNLQVRVSVIDDCSGGDLPGNAPPGAVKLIERRFSASDGGIGIPAASCSQLIWVVDFDPFTITDTQCGLVNSDDVRWPCDLLLDNCPDGGLTPEDLETILPVNQKINARPVVTDDACSLIGVTYEDQRFDFVDGACFKILRRWSVIDWCQYNSLTGAGLWHYTQVIKVHDEAGPAFVNCPTEPVKLCVSDEGVTLPDNNQVFLGEGNPLASSCSAHLNLSRTVHEACSDFVQFDVKIYPFNGAEYILVKSTATASVDENNNAILSFNTRDSNIPSIRNNGIPYNSPWCGDYHRILWSVEDGCGNWSHCEYLFRLEDCKQPTPVCINGISTVIMPIGCQITIWAKDFNASSYDDCTPAANLLYSFSGDAYQPSFTYTADNIPAFGVELPTNIWVADGGVDHNCNGQIEWSERNKDYCTTNIVILDNNNVCGGSGSILAGEILTDQTESVEKVDITLTSPGHYFPSYATQQNGQYKFTGIPYGQDYTISAERNDDHRNGVSTLDLVKIQKHLLGKELFTSPYQYIAADANNSQQVSAIDLIEIRKLILGIYSEYPSNNSWRFVEKGYEMNPSHPWPFSEQILLPILNVDSVMHNDFVAVKVGDVNNTAKASASSIQPRNGRRILPVSVMVKNEVIAGDMVEMKLTIPESVNGFQWTFETEGLEFADVISEVIHIDEQHVGLIGKGLVTMSWNGEFPEENSIDNISFTLRWKATESGRLNDMVRLTSLITAAEAYTVHDEILDVRLAFANNQDARDFALYQNKPNPWNGQTTIGFDLPEDGNAILSIYDVTGKEVLQISGEYKSGYNTINLNQKDLPDTGIMYYRLDSGTYSATKKMVMIR